MHPRFGVRSISLGLRRLFRRSVAEQELSDEIAQYLEASADEHMRAGLSRDEAMRRARVEFGGVEAAKETYRAAGWDGAIDTLVRDTQYALRGFRASPGYFLLAVAMLSIGMALSISVLTVASTILGEQWRVRESDRLFRIINARGGP